MAGDVLRGLPGGTVPVPLNFRLHPSEWVHLLTDAGARALVAQAQYVADIDRVRARFAGTVESFVSSTARPRGSP